ncbi:MULTISPECIES: selenide, water dikinase SelD [Cyanophyceae]|uniref:selenide, water dikinase SelD n=1 Tax=Cyanophyceae TaxID=3028117 RepID=UPI0016830219|nr:MULTISPECIES: selenide, water dikinase SelD [Cyanophyceae]MBD1915129.1 selenide, water dikinase SelD [Phormidium sp. FACHB-77]MBD2032015.1 selenide, water dikinase SelD [Phormidium sp. FACHB-322]MBD2050489.1 selenide, water dikinase SelD [Leptolyngbya sp. FACHB-60]
MMQTEPTISTDVVLVGGGHTHALVLRQWGMAPMPGVRLTLLSDLVDTPYSGMLPSYVAGRYSFDEAHIDLRPLTRFAQCRLVVDRAVGLDLAQQRVLCANHPALAYDVLSIDTGSTPATLSVPGAAEYAIAAKPVPTLLHQWQQLVENVAANPQKPLTLTVVGGGVGGVELAIGIHERLVGLLEDLGQPGANLTLHLFHRGKELAPERNRWTRRRLERVLRDRGIHLHRDEAVKEIGLDDGSGQRVVRGSSGLTVECDRVFWVTSAAAPGWLQDSGLSLTDQGFIQVGDTLQTLSHPNVFAAGDVATMMHHPRPKAGVFAVRQGAPLTDNLRRFVQGEPLKPFRPQRQFLSLIETGNGNAIADRGPFSIESPLAHRWKDHIDRRFMARFRDLPIGRMTQSAAKTPAAVPPSPPCAGCGSKVGSTALAEALYRVRQDFSEVASEAVLIGLDAPDDAAVVTVPPGKVMVQTVDYFTALLDDPFIFAQICLKHCLGDLYAMGAQPHTVLALVQVPYATPAKQAEMLYQILAGTFKGLLAANALLVGGHTVVGPQLALGFACNGVANPNALLRKGGMQPGDALILTQPLGTGTLFAADMQGKAKGRWIEDAIAHLLTPNQAAAEIFCAHRATACTDVTGFGLAGHLLEMVRAANVTATLAMDALPVLTGAADTLSAGFLSTLHPQNLQAAALIDSAGVDHPLYPLLFDPQTAGGLLAAVPAATAQRCLNALHSRGYSAAVQIGEVGSAFNGDWAIHTVAAL